MIQPLVLFSIVKFSVSVPFFLSDVYWNLFEKTLSAIYCTKVETAVNLCALWFMNGSGLGWRHDVHHPSNLFFPLPLSLSLCLLGDLYFHLKQYSNVVSKHGQWPNINLYGYIMDKVSTNMEAEPNPGPSDSNLTTAPSPSPADCH